MPGLVSILRRTVASFALDPSGTSPHLHATMTGHATSTTTWERSLSAVAPELCWETNPSRQYGALAPTRRAGFWPAVDSSDLTKIGFDFSAGYPILGSSFPRACSKRRVAAWLYSILRCQEPDSSLTGLAPGSTCPLGSIRLVFANGSRSPMLRFSFTISRRSKSAVQQVAEANGREFQTDGRRSPFRKQIHAME